MRRALTIYAALTILLQLLAGWVVHQMSRAWLDMFIYGYIGFAVRSSQVMWMVRLSRLVFYLPAGFFAVAAFIIWRHKSDKALLHTLFAGLAIPIAIAALGTSLFLAELTSGTWSPKSPERENISQHSHAR